MKQAIRSFLTILLLLCAVTTLNATVYKGSCGDNVSYSLNTNTGVLSITGTGSMNDYSFFSSTPWYSYCSYIKTVTIYEGVTSIGYWAFSNCSELTSITIPNSVTSIENSAFAGCSGLTNIKVDEGNKTFDSRENCNAIINSTTNELIAGCRNTIIPNSVTNIRNSAFFNCWTLTSITIPNSVINIGNSAFHYCIGLTSVTIGNSVTDIGAGAFYNCSGLTNIIIPNSVTSIGNEAFYDCKELRDITVLSSEPPTISSSTFNNYTATLHVQKGCAAAYKSNSYWGKFNIIEDAINPNIKGTCAVPAISYSNGKISCTCETEGAVCHYTYKYGAGEGKGENNGNISGQITITAYATADDYADSETVTKTFDLTGASASDNCDVNGDGVVNMEDANIVVNKYLGK